jgi:hypothetical protein
VKQPRFARQESRPVVAQNPKKRNHEFLSERQLGSLTAEVDALKHWIGDSE